jgi:hAT family C-terminal dimerisation region
MTIPVTTASVERGFSKLTYVKNKLRSTMLQDRLEALMLAAVEKDLILQLSNDDLVSKFAGATDRRLDLG